VVVNLGLIRSGCSSREFIERDLQDIGDAHDGIELRRCQTAFPTVIERGLTSSSSARRVWVICLAERNRRI